MTIKPTTMAIQLKDGFKGSRMIPKGSTNTS